MFDNLRRSLYEYWDRPNRLCKEMAESKAILKCSTCGELYPTSDPEGFDLISCPDCMDKYEYLGRDLYSFKYRYKLLWRAILTGPNELGKTPYAYFLFFKLIIAMLIDNQYRFFDSKGNYKDHYPDTDPVTCIGDIDDPFNKDQVAGGWHILYVTVKWWKFQYFLDYDYPDHEY